MRTGQDRRATGTARRTLCCRSVAVRTPARGVRRAGLSVPLLLLWREGQARLDMAAQACTGMQFWFPVGASFG